MKRYYLAYGSNLNIEQMRYRCPRAKVMGTSMIPGYELLFKGSRTGAYLTIEKKEGGMVPVAVWEVTEKDEKALDRYEGYPAFYYKAGADITYIGLKTGKEYEAKGFIYIMHEERQIGKPTLWYVRSCLEGYRSFGFDDGYLMKAVERSGGYEEW